MVVDLMKWMRPQSSKSYEALIRVRYLKWVREIEVDCDDQSRPSSSSGGRRSKLTVEIRWKGSKGNGFMDLSKKLKRSCTREEVLDQNGVVQFDEVFRNVCRFSVWNNRDGCFSPWEVAFIVLNASDKGQKNNLVVAGPAILNLAEFFSIEDEQELEISIPLTQSTSVECSPTLYLSLHLRETRTNQELLKTFQRSWTINSSALFPPCFAMPATLEEDESSVERKRLRKAKSLKESVSFSKRKANNAYRVEAISDGSEKSEDNCSIYRHSLSYNDQRSISGRMRHLRSSYDEGWVYYNNPKPESDSLYIGDDMPPDTLERKSKLSPKIKKSKSKLIVKSVKIKGEPLLKKEYGERGGDDIDFIRWQLCSDVDSIITGCHKEFGDDSFTVGSWEYIEVVSRDGSLKLQTQVFFATIDQMSEKAAGESACTVLVVVLTHWLHLNQGQLPVQSEFDRLIREGSRQWRKLCEKKSNMDRFPDKHFDLETVLQAKICPISVVSTTGFFQPEEIEDEILLEYLEQINSFDSVWDEICAIAAERDYPLICIVSWNDHFFIVKVDADAYYVIDTLGERLHEGCNRAYMLKFGKDTEIRRVRTQPSNEHLKSAKLESEKAEHEGLGEEETVVCRGKDACKEYITSFLATVRIREWQADMKEGRMRSKPLNELLQIDVHYTEFSST